ncbi:MAG: hypothetical protein Q9172_005316 [Xanthocarpia lactea]
MPPSRNLLVRDNADTVSTPNTGTLTPTMNALLIALAVLFLTGFALVGVLLLLRSHRRTKRQQGQSLPVHNCSSKRASNHRRLTISATPYAHGAKDFTISSEKEVLCSPASSAPSSPVPEIRITFPEEEDDSGKRKSGRVVVVTISEKGHIGLEPYHDEHLPPYAQDDAERFQSLDLDRIGGLKEVDLQPKRA